MLKKTVPYILTLFFVVSCYKLKEPEKPKNLISKNDMVNILIDLQLLSSITAASDLKVLDSNHVKAEKYIFNKYHIDSTQFALSNDYYAFYIDDYEDIYDKVKDSLEALNAFYEKLEQEELEEIDETDSIMEIRSDVDNRRGMIKPVSDTDSQLLE